tara:strand:+ start:1096 stop:1299 length:204 start_codon:yes stop_codon:yes gene_type:complete
LFFAFISFCSCVFAALLVLISSVSLSFSSLAFGFSSVLKPESDILFFFSLSAAISLSKRSLAIVKCF